MRIITLVILIHFHPGQAVFPDTIPHFLIHIALDTLHGGILFNPFPHVLLCQLQFPAENLDYLFPILYLIIDNGYGAYRPVIRQNLAVTV